MNHYLDLPPAKVFGAGITTRSSQQETRQAEREPPDVGVGADISALLMGILLKRAGIDRFSNLRKGEFHSSFTLKSADVDGARTVLFTQENNEKKN